MLAQLGGEAWRTTLGRDDGQLVATRCQPQAKTDGTLAKFDTLIHISMASLSSSTGGFEA